MKCAHDDLSLEWRLGSSDGHPVMELFDVKCKTCGTAFLFLADETLRPVAGVSKDRGGVILGLEQISVN